MIRYLVCTILGWMLALGAVGLAAVGDPPAKEPEPVLKKKQKKEDGSDLPKQEPDPKSKKDPKDDEPILKKKPKKDDKPDPKDPKEVDPKDVTPLPPTEKPEEILKRVRENMEAAEKRLKEQDPGTATRKLQRDIVRDLDDLINQQNDDNSGGDGGGGGGKQKKRQRSQANNQGKSGGKGDPKKGDPKTAQEPKSGTGDTGNGGKKSEAGKANSPADFAEWGHLPAHKRMELDAYSRDRFMREYELLLRQYYRTIAEQGRRKE